MNNFDKYVGQKVLLIGTKKTIELESIGKHEYTNYDIAPEDTVIAEITSLHPNCRVWLPGTMGTCDYNLSRLNVHVEEQADGSFEIVRVNFG